jgi:hypothetical protein
MPAPPLRLRPAAVEDHDDLLPLLPHGAHAALARHGGTSTSVHAALLDDAATAPDFRALAACGPDGRAVGCVMVTRDVGAAGLAVGAGLAGAAGLAAGAGDGFAEDLMAVADEVGAFVAGLAAAGFISTEVMCREA